MRVTYTVATLAVVVPVLAARGTGLPPPLPKPAAQAMVADVTVVGKVTEIEEDWVEAKPHFGAPTDGKVPYTVAVIKIDTALVGAKGLTTIRVGLSDAAGGTGGPVAPLGPRPAPARLAVGQEGCFFLDRHPAADFHVLRAGDVWVPKADKDYDDVMAEVRVVAQALADPIAALRAKAPEDRFLAAATLLARGPRLGTNGLKDTDTEDVPAEANKLVLGVLLEMPWTRRTYTQDRRVGPNLTREGMWHAVGAEAYGFKLPHAGPTPRGVSPPDMSKERDEASAAFLKENLDRVQLKRMARPK
jgi:hypothetical protein